MAGELMALIGFTMACAGLSTVLVLVPGVPLAYLLARHEFPGKRVLATLTSLPLVLPPTAVGYLLLRLFADDGLAGREMLGFDLGILLTWKGVVVACAAMSVPLVVRTARISFEAVDARLETMARTLGDSRIRAFMRVTLPLAGRGLLASAVLGFTRAMGEFGATMMVAGNIPGRTQTLSGAIFSAQQAGDGTRATILLSLALGLGFVAVFLTEWLSRPLGSVLRGEARK